jgi:hypothetical protein
VLVKAQETWTETLKGTEKVLVKAQETLSDSPKATKKAILKELVKATK